MGDFYAGYCDADYVRVSDAVAASSAFPPGFTRLSTKAFRPRVLTQRPMGGKADRICQWCCGAVRSQE